jgi:hypothetical protein
MARKHRKPTMSEVHDRYEAHDYGQQTEKRKKKNHNKNEKARGVPVYPDRNSMYYGAHRVFGVGEVARPPRDAAQHNTPPSAYTSPPQKNGTTRPKYQPVHVSREGPLVSPCHGGGQGRPVTSSRHPRGLGAHHSSSSQDPFSDRHGYYDHPSSSPSSDANYSTQAAQSCTTCDDSSIFENVPLSSSSASIQSSSGDLTHRHPETSPLRVPSSRKQASPKRTPVRDHRSSRKTVNPLSATVESVSSDGEDDNLERRPVHPSRQKEDEPAPKASVTSTSADEVDDEVDDLYTADALPASKQARFFPSSPCSKPNERPQRSSTPYSSSRDDLGEVYEHMPASAIAGSQNDEIASEGEGKTAEDGASSSRKRTSVSFSTPLTEVRTYGKKDKSGVVKKTQGIFEDV